MKIEIDTINKTILVKEFINIESLVKELEKMNIDFKEYSLKTDVVYSSYNYPMMQLYGTGVTNQCYNTPVIVSTNA